MEQGCCGHQQTHLRATAETRTIEQIDVAIASMLVGVGFSKAMIVPSYPLSSMTDANVLALFANLGNQVLGKRRTKSQVVFNPPVAPRTAMV